jgi:gluconolactonase
LLSPSEARGGSDGAPRLEGFTQRQAQILDCLRRGMANKLIAYELNMCESTVKVHIRNIMKKLNATNRTQVVYLTNGLFEGGSIWRKPTNFANGNTRDRQGRLITCEHGRRITRTEYDGSITVLMDRWQGKRLNSPNDVVVKSDGSIWFTDPPFGLLGNYEGVRAEPELPQSVYRIDACGEACLIADDFLGPNGLCFSPDEKLLYIVESRGQPHRKILAYDVAADGRTISGKRVLIDAGPGGTPDGMRCDVDGNLWCGWGMGSAELDGVLVFAPDGTKIGRIALPERCANVCFGGALRNRLFMAASQSIYALYVNTQGAPGG